MRAHQQLVLAVLALAAPVAQAFLGSTPRTSFVARSTSASSTSRSVAATFTTTSMDMETSLDVKSRKQIESFLHSAGSAGLTVEEAAATQGMPWKKSIDASLDADALLYMPFWEWQMEFMKENLTNLRALPCSSSQDSEKDFGYEENLDKKARIVSACFSSDEYRKIRMTYYDAGDNTQVFNSVWYPNPKYNLPILGVDLLSFNRKKYLAIVDFQPIHSDEADHATTFEEKLLDPIKSKYDSLKGKMSSKFYDETQFFSQQMLFARFEDEKVVTNDLFPAYKEYVQTHVDMVKDQEDGDATQMASILARQKAYDSYSAERDPATGLFAAMFGKDWADGFVYDFLFGLAERPEGGLVIPPMPGAPPPKATAKQPVAQ